MAKDFGRLLAAKDELQYGLTVLESAKARRLLGCARRLSEVPQVVEA